MRFCGRAALCALLTGALMAPLAASAGYSNGPHPAWSAAGRIYVHSPYWPRAHRLLRRDGGFYGWGYGPTWGLGMRWLYAVRT